MTSLKEQRRAIRPLLDEREAEDALAAYYAFYHDDARTQLIVRHNEEDKATGYIAISRTGMDLFRPLVTLRLPASGIDDGRELITRALPEGAGVILYAPAGYVPLLSAFFDFETDELYRLFVLNPNRFEPIINVLVTQAESPDGLPRFVIRSQQDPEQVIAAAGLNWLTRYFAEISVHTAPGQRRQGLGRSVVAAMVHYLLERGVTPLYVTGEHNQASLELAERVGFRDTGRRTLFSAAVRKSPL